MASTSNITAGENQDFSKSVDEKVEGVQPPILEDGVNAKGIGGDKLAQLSYEAFRSASIDTGALDQLGLSAENQKKIVDDAKSERRFCALKSVLNAVSF